MTGAAICAGGLFVTCGVISWFRAPLSWDFFSVGCIGFGIGLVLMAETIFAVSMSAWFNML